jgi:hypothetical protein
MSYFAATLKDGSEWNFNYQCNKVLHNNPNLCIFINQNELGNTVLALIPYNEIRSIQRGADDEQINTSF